MNVLATSSCRPPRHRIIPGPAKAFDRWVPRARSLQDRRRNDNTSVGALAITQHPRLRHSRRAWRKIPKIKASLHLKSLHLAAPSLAQLADVGAQLRIATSRAGVHYISRVVEAGTNLTKAMQLARHMDPKLTLKTYANAGMHNLSRVVMGWDSATGRDDAD